MRLRGRNLAGRATAKYGPSSDGCSRTDCGAVDVQTGEVRVESSAVGVDGGQWSRTLWRGFPRANRSCVRRIAVVMRRSRISTAGYNGSINSAGSGRLATVTGLGSPMAKVRRETPRVVTVGWLALSGSRVARRPVEGVVGDLFPAGLDAGEV